jgi:predicted solute-binding protein
MLHGAQKGLFDLDFQVPSECARRLASGAADIGIVPSIELTRQDLEIIPGAGIASHGAVRSILLVTRRPVAAIRTLAADEGSRTSVELARVVLDRRYGAAPEIFSHPPDLDAMLAAADAALLIGDSALRVDPARVNHIVLDLGAEWTAMTGLPMVFAVWAGRPGSITPEVAEAFLASCRFGRASFEDIVAREAPARHLPLDLVREYLARNVIYELGPAEDRGLRLFLEYAAASTFSSRRASP